MGEFANLLKRLTYEKLEKTKEILEFLKDNPDIDPILVDLILEWLEADLKLTHATNALFEWSNEILETNNKMLMDLINYINSGKSFPLGLGYTEKLRNVINSISKIKIKKSQK